jgi:UDP-N-acetylmuramate--alanine ligase
MSGLARILLSKKEKVSGSDLAANYITDGLQKAGADVYVGHSSKYISPDMTVIYNTDIKEDNPEFQAALHLKCSLLHRSDLLLQLMSGYKILAVTGTHGKTTTSALLAAVLVHSGIDPAFAVGGILPQFHSNAHHGSGEYFVAEADESDGTFLKYNPWASIVTNIDNDHMDYFKTETVLDQSFQVYMEKIPDDGWLFWHGDDARLSKMNPKGISYGFGNHHKLSISKFRQDGWKIFFSIEFNQTRYEEVEVALTGRHNALNAAAVFGLAIALELPEQKIREALRTFKGVVRRCEHKYEGKGISILDDYAHHPVEVQATLKAVREAIQERRLVAVFQPHRYTRTKACLGTFKNCFNEADELVITDIYGAGETPIGDLSAVQIADEVKSASSVSCRYVPKSELISALGSLVRPHDVVITLGAGDITKTGLELASFLEAHPPKKYRVGVIYGGRSIEHEVSLLSAANVCEAFNSTLYDVNHFGITKEGKWITGAHVPQQLQKMAKEIPSQPSKTPISSEILSELYQCDLLFPILHGKLGEDGTLQGFFEILGKPYMGCDHRSAAIAMDKALTKKLMVLNGVATLPFVDFNHTDWKRFPELLLEQIKTQLILPVFIKPVHLGSSMGVTKVDTFENLISTIEMVFRFDSHLIVENGVVAREIEFAVLGNQWIKVFPPGEICTEGKIYDYEGKYGASATKTVPRTDLTQALIEEGMFLAETAYKAAGCTGMARIDFFLDRNDKFWLNEINPIPGFTCNSLYPSICKANGLDYPQLIDKLVILAFERSRQGSKVG